MIRPSPELLAVSRRWYDAIVNKQPKSLQNLLSETDHLRFVGTAEGEIWGGRAVRDAISAYFEEVPEVIRHEETFAEAFETDKIGWSCFTNNFWFNHRPDQPIEFRTTLIFALEDGSWKIVQRHASLPVANDTMGFEQTGIPDLVAAAEQSFPADQIEGLASIVFTDIVNSSRIAEAMGDRLWSRTVEDHFATLRGIIEKSGGQLVKSLGDGTLSRFDSARQALRASVEMQRAVSGDANGPDLALRIGVHSGDVVQARDDFLGTVVNKAARITAAAEAGAIFVSDATRLLVADSSEFAFGGTLHLTLKGFQGEHAIHRLDWTG